MACACTSVSFGAKGANGSLTSLSEREVADTCRLPATVGTGGGGGVRSPPPPPPPQAASPAASAAAAIQPKFERVIVVGEGMFWCCCRGEAILPLRTRRAFWAKMPPPHQR